MYKDEVDRNLPGGSDYQEVVFTWDDAPDGGHKVYMSHFDDDNQIAHALTRDRILEDGSSTLHIDELQSDLHKEGSRRGYIGDENYIKAGELIDSKIPEYEKNINDLLDIYEREIDLLNILSSRKEIIKEELLRLRTTEGQSSLTAESAVEDINEKFVGFGNLQASLKSIRNDLRDYDNREIFQMVSDLVDKTSGLEDRAGRLATNTSDRDWETFR